MSMYQMAAGITVLQKIILCAFFWLAWQVTGCRAYLEAAKDAEGEDGFRPLTFHSWMVYDETWIEMDDLEVPSLYRSLRSQTVPFFEIYSLSSSWFWFELFVRQSYSNSLKEGCDMEYCDGPTRSTEDFLTPNKDEVCHVPSATSNVTGNVISPGWAD